MSVRVPYPNQHAAPSTQHVVMSLWERRGRIVLSLAVLGLFLSVVSSMIAGRYLWPLIVGCLAIGVVGGAAMAWGRRFG